MGEWEDEEEGNKQKNWDKTEDEKRERRGKWSQGSNFHEVATRVSIKVNV